MHAASQLLSPPRRYKAPALASWLTLRKIISLVKTTPPSNMNCSKSAGWQTRPFSPVLVWGETWRKPAAGFGEDRARSPVDTYKMLLSCSTFVMAPLTTAVGGSPPACVGLEASPCCSAASTYPLTYICSQGRTYHLTQSARHWRAAWLTDWLWRPPRPWAQATRSIHHARAVHCRRGEVGWTAAAPSRAEHGMAVAGRPWEWQEVEEERQKHEVTWTDGGQQTHNVRGTTCSDLFFFLSSSETT